MAEHELYVVQGKTLDNIAGTMRAVLGVDKDTPIRFDEVASNDKTEQINADIEAQADIIEQIKIALNGKAAGGVAKKEQEKTVDITENGITEILPDEGKTLSKVAVNVAVESGNTSGKALLSFEDYDEEGFPSTLRYNCPDEATLGSLFYTGDASTGVFSSKIKKVILPNYTTKISDCTFCGMSGIEELSNWDYITYIGNKAFSRNNNPYDTGRGIQHVYFPPNLTYIGNSGFFRTAGKIETEIPDTVTYIGKQAFTYGGNSSKVLTKLPSNLTYIGDQAFLCYFRFENLEIPAAVDYIGASAFDGRYHKNELKTVKFKGTPSTIGTDVFVSNTSLANIYCPWAEGTVANAPWGATNATIHYDTTYDENGNPIDCSCEPETEGCPDAES